MSVLVQASDAFYVVCSFLARRVRNVADGADYVIQQNYNFVTAVYSLILRVGLFFTSTASQIWNVAQAFAGSVLDFIIEVHSVIASVLLIVVNGFLAVYQFFESVFSSVANFVCLCGLLLFRMYTNTRETIADIYEHVAFVSSSSVNFIHWTMNSIFSFFTSVGSNCVNFVSGTWHGLGYVLSSVAYFPVMCMDAVESAKQRLTDFIIHAITFTPKETYLGVVCLCLVYFMLSNALRYLTCRGMPLFSSHLSSSRRRRSVGSHAPFGWHFDREFESDFEEDLYSSDMDDRVWDNHDGDARDSEASDDDDNGSSNIGDSDDSDGSDGTVENSEDDDDDDSDDNDDNQTVISDDSDSEGSLISQTFSNASSDHGIEVQLPPMGERYSLRSRSSTPCKHPNSLSSPEEFDREIERERDKRKCVVCQDNIKSVLVMPCRHMCMCIGCANHIVRSRTVGRRVCPLCRTRIQRVMDVYV